MKCCTGSAIRADRSAGICGACFSSIFIVHYLYDGEISITCMTRKVPIFNNHLRFG